MTPAGRHPRKPVRVGVADKSPLIQAALKHLFAEDPRFELVGVFEDGEAFLEAALRHGFEVGVVGWVIAPSDARFILDHLRSQADAPRIVVYTGMESSRVPARVMAHGGAAFVSKSEQPEVLLDTIVAVAAGRMVFPYLDVTRINENPLARLTRRELEVLSDLAAGNTNKQIADKHGVSLNTVKFHLRNTFQKLGVSSRGQAISLYLRS